ncbi:MAG: hypothetical protein WC655_12085 [Candidatus Hydrogenedentales bacterium]|jgi:hypothetical protein
MTMEQTIGKALRVGPSIALASCLNAALIFSAYPTLLHPWAPVPPIYALLALFAIVSLPLNAVYFSAAIAKRKAGHSLFGLVATILSLAQTAFVLEILRRPLY